MLLIAAAPLVFAITIHACCRAMMLMKKTRIYCSGRYHYAVKMRCPLIAADMACHTPLRYAAALPPRLLDAAYAACRCCHAAMPLPLLCYATSYATRDCCLLPLRRYMPPLVCLRYCLLFTPLLMFAEVLPP